MTIQEAIKTGRKFKRAGEDRWWTRAFDVWCFKEEQLLATDWVVETEVLEFECGWRVHDFNICPGIPSNDYDLNNLVGKKTRVRIEVIND